jgi:Toxin PAAR-like domain/GHH signature containing HNH/Endo VII superfamily nuclease toxin  2
MSNQVYANDREISCKSGEGKSICAFPDVCMTPPENPATPPGVPIPYPNTGLASETTDGSKSVQISGKEVMLKNKSYFKKSMGDEAGCAAKKGVITSVNRGKVYFIAWSMDVKVEGENAVRHLDMTTHNHASPEGNESIPWPYTDRMVLIQVPGCEKERAKIDAVCGNPFDKNKATCPNPSAVNDAKARHDKAVEEKKKGPERTKKKKEAYAELKAAQVHYDREVQRNECTRVLRCALVPYDKGKAEACCAPQTPDHLVPASQFGENRGAGTKYKEDKAPCMCATGNAHTATHGLLGRARTRYMKNIKKSNFNINAKERVWTVQESCECGAASAAQVTGCTKECLEAQLKKGHEDMKIDLQQKISTKKETVPETNEDLDAMQEVINEFPIALD